MCFQEVDPTHWPSWGYDDLWMGYDGSPGMGGHCDQGATYAGSRNAACGGDYNWLADLEVWYPVA